MWLGWKTNINLKEFMTLGMIAVVSFAAWNGIMLQGLAGNALPGTLISNFIHWSLYFLTGVLVSRYLQWSTSIGIWPKKERAGCTMKSPAKLSVRKLFFLTLLVGCGSIAYRVWIKPIPNATSNESMFHWFPIELKPIRERLDRRTSTPFAMACYMGNSSRQVVSVSRIDCLDPMLDVRPLGNWASLLGGKPEALQF
jgi:hypothetical protein